MTTQQTQTTAPEPHDRRLEDRYVTKERHILSLGGVAVIVISAIAILFNMARSGAEDAAARPVAELGARVTVVEKNYDALEKKVDTVDQKVDAVKKELGDSIRSSEDRVLREVAAGRQDTQNLQTLLLTGKVQVPKPTQ